MLHAITSSNSHITFDFQNIPFVVYIMYEPLNVNVINILGSTFSQKANLIIKVLIFTKNFFTQKLKTILILNYACYDGTVLKRSVSWLLLLLTWQQDRVTQEEKPQMQTCFPQVVCRQVCREFSWFMFDMQ